MLYHPDWTVILIIDCLIQTYTSFIKSKVYPCLCTIFCINISSIVCTSARQISITKRTAFQYRPSACLCIYISSQDIPRNICNPKLSLDSCRYGCLYCQRKCLRLKSFNNTETSCIRIADSGRQISFLYACNCP